MAIVYLLIALRPTTPLNPFPPPTASPSAPPTVEEPTATPVPTPTPFPTPTALHPATLTPTPEPSFPFTATVETGPQGETANCRLLLNGAVLDREGHGLESYPVHLWTMEATAQNVDQILFSDRSGRWQAVLPVEARVWYVQLHSPDARQVYPPLSAVVAVTLSAPCSQARVVFREQ
ncbi:MAG: hypothetical protein H5T61_14200 [Thermoflexales bacterium]|nr:hypothetical protein [Thermoflexales bacterium]